MDFDWGSEIDHLMTPTWWEEQECDDLESAEYATRKCKRDRAVSAFLALTGHFLKYPGSVGKYRTPDVTQEFRYQRCNFLPWARGMGEHLFRRYFCMPFGAFQRLVSYLKPSLYATYKARGRWNSDSQAGRSSGRFVTRITAEMKVAMGLHWLAGGAYQAIAAFHGVSLTSFWRAKDAFLEAVNACAELDISFPALDNDEKLRDIADGFQSLSQDGCFADCMGALDGILISLAFVNERDTTQPVKFFTCKGSFALNVQAEIIQLVDPILYNW
eukprot:3935490-Rhodomonas_salina.1